MATLTPLVEYLLARRSGKTYKPLCMWGMLGVQGQYPPNFSLTYESRPQTNAYANIVVWYRESPALMPGVFQIDSFSEGVTINTGPVTAADIGWEMNQFIVITHDFPTTVTITNLTPLIQEEDFSEVYLVVHDIDSFKTIWDIVEHWGNSIQLEELIREQTEVLRSMGAVGPNRRFR